MRSLWAARIRGGSIATSWAALTTGLMCVLVVAAMISAALLARQSSDRHRRVQVLVQQLLASSQEMSALKWQANTQVLLGHAQFTLSSPYVRSGTRILSELGGEAARLQRMAPGGDTTRLARDVHDLIAGSLRQLTVLQTPGFRRAATLARMQREFQPFIDRLDHDAQRAAASQQSVAAQALRSSLLASIGSLLLGLGALGAVGWRFARLRRRSALAEELRVLERRSESRIRALFEDSSDVVSVLDGDLGVRWQSASVKELIGHEPGSLVGTQVASIVHPDDQPLFETFLRARLGGGPAASLRLRLAHADGGWRHVEVVAKDRRTDAAIEGIVLTMRDIAERMAFEDELRRQAFHDVLTGLANRALFEDRLRHALAGTLRTQRSLAVLFVDLDDFKTVNDSLGHRAGDSLLCTVAARIDPLVRPTDTAARLGGDEFAVLLDGVSAEEAQAIAARVLAAVGEPIAVDERELTVTASIGVAVTDGSLEAGELLRNADIAMYAAKASGKNALRMFEPEMHQTAVERLELRSELPRALENHEFCLEYQPIVSLQTERMVGVEALVRWEHPTRGRLSPAAFITLAEESGLVVGLGRWVLERACAQAHAWHQVQQQSPPLYVTVNVSIRQLRDDDFPDTVADVLARTGLDPRALVLELTEGMLADDPEAIVERLRRLKHLGLRVAIDDFGTGYSGLSHLHQFPIDVLKIDKSFIDRLTTDDQQASLVQAIINLGGSMQLDVIAEGIEHNHQADRLRAMRSPLGQGYLYSRPVGPDQVLALLRGPDAPVSRPAE